LAAPEDMYALLRRAQTHSNRLGYRWHPDKCAVLNSPEWGRAYTLYGQELSKVPFFKYLGIPFSREGIDFVRLVNDRSHKATSIMALFRKKGEHQYGLGLWSALRTYRTFVRPVLEYGLAVAWLAPPQLAVLEKAQKGCIQMAMNSSPSANRPTISLLALADLPSLQARWRILQFKFASRAMQLPMSTMLRVSLRSLTRHGATLDNHWRVISERNPVW
ncbi:hypothetical protein BCR43DRAFT_417462, partial [Syncephalastrum racemosum]